MSKVSQAVLTLRLLQSTHQPSILILQTLQGVITGEGNQEEGCFRELVRLYFARVLEDAACHFKIFSNVSKESEGKK